MWRSSPTCLPTSFQSDGTLLDHTCVLYIHEHAEADSHKNSGLAMITAPCRGLKTGLHTRMAGTIGDLYLTIAEEVMGAPIGSFPSGDKKLNAPIVFEDLRDAGPSIEADRRLVSRHAAPRSNLEFSRKLLRAYPYKAKLSPSRTQLSSSSSVSERLRYRGLLPPETITLGEAWRN